MRQATFMAILGVLTGVRVGGCSDDGAGANEFVNPLTNPEDGPPAGNLDGHCDVPAAARPEDTSQPDHVVGTGSKESCTPEAFIDAVARGGVITFDPTLDGASI